jgi:hypothetical protein
VAAAQLYAIGGSVAVVTMETEIVTMETEIAVETGIAAGAVMETEVQHLTDAMTSTIQLSLSHTVPMMTKMTNLADDEDEKKDLEMKNPHAEGARGRQLRMNLKMSWMMTKSRDGAQQRHFAIWRRIGSHARREQMQIAN